MIKQAAVEPGVVWVSMSLPQGRRAIALHSLSSSPERADIIPKTMVVTQAMINV
jgi:hypothetical protein